MAVIKKVKPLGQKGDVWDQNSGMTKTEPSQESVFTIPEAEGMGLAELLKRHLQQWPRQEKNLIDSWTRNPELEENFLRYRGKKPIGI